MDPLQKKILVNIGREIAAFSDNSFRVQARSGFSLGYQESV